MRHLTAWYLRPLVLASGPVWSRLNHSAVPGGMVTRGGLAPAGPLLLCEQAGQALDVGFQLGDAAL
jgi:hypothetical protein